MWTDLDRTHVSIKIARTQLMEPSAVTAVPGSSLSFLKVGRSSGTSGGVNEHAQVEIRIRDNGTRLEEGASSKIFDHFFTTKDIGKGTGLGLAISRQIIEENHSGKLYVEPTTARGVEFIICLETKLSA